MIRRSKTLGRVAWSVFRFSPLTWVLQSFWPPRAYVKIEYKGKILLVQNWFGSGKWSFPGGGVHFREDSKTGACREVLEETGLILKPSNLKFLTAGFTKYLFSSMKFVIYESTLETQPNIILDSELTDYQWVSHSEIENYDLTNAVKVALAKKQLA